MIEKVQKTTNRIDTDPYPRPGDFALGSMESRAAARAQLEKKSPFKKPGVQQMSERDSKGFSRPGDFPVGSIESRAAARALLKQRDQVDLSIVSYRVQQENGRVVEIVFL